MHNEAMLHGIVQFKNPHHPAAAERAPHQRFIPAKGFVAFGQQKTIAPLALHRRLGVLFGSRDEVFARRTTCRKSARAMEKHLAGKERVEALAFDYLHFYGNKTTIAWSPGWYRKRGAHHPQHDPRRSLKRVAFSVWKWSAPKEIALPAWRRIDRAATIISLRLGAQR